MLWIKPWLQKLRKSLDTPQNRNFHVRIALPIYPKLRIHRAVFHCLQACVRVVQTQTGLLESAMDEVLRFDLNDISNCSYFYISRIRLSWPTFFVSKSAGLVCYDAATGGGGTLSPTELAGIKIYYSRSGIPSDVSRRYPKFVHARAHIHSERHASCNSPDHGSERHLLGWTLTQGNYYHNPSKS